MEFVKSLTAEVEFSTLNGGRIIYAVFVAYKSKKKTVVLRFANFTPFEKTCFVTSLKKQCHIFEITRNPSFLRRKIYKSL